MLLFWTQISYSHIKELRDLNTELYFSFGVSSAREHVDLIILSLCAGSVPGVLDYSTQNVNT